MAQNRTNLCKEYLKKPQNLYIEAQANPTQEVNLNIQLVGMQEMVNPAVEVTSKFKYQKFRITDARATLL